MSSFTLAWHFLIFGVLPYVVIAVLVLGSLARFVLAPFSWKAKAARFWIRRISSGAPTFSISA